MNSIRGGRLKRALASDLDQSTAFLRDEAALDAWVRKAVLAKLADGHVRL